MRYMLVNTSTGSIKLDLLSPEIDYNYKNLNRQGPLVSLSIKRGLSINILPRFGGSVEKAYASIKFSPDAIKLIGPNGPLIAFVCDDEGKQIDIEKLLSKKVTKKSEPVENPKIAEEPPKAEEPKPKEPVIESPKAEELAVVEEPKVEEPVVEPLKVEEQVGAAEEKAFRTTKNKKKR